MKAFLISTMLTLAVVAACFTLARPGRADAPATKDKTKSAAKPKSIKADSKKTDAAKEKDGLGKKESAQGEESSKQQEPDDPKGLRRLQPDGIVWLDLDHKRVILEGQVCFREGQLEMFACLANTKEHESIVSIPTQAFIVHAALVRVGAKPGNPVQFVPKFKPAQGTEVDITVFWTDAEGKRQHLRAQEWIKQVKTGDPMPFEWVFGGSSFWKDERTGENHYQAESGDFICVSNFSSAMLDLPVQSSQTAGDLLFEAFSDKIPPLGTPVTLVLTPKLDEEQPADDEAKQQPTDEDADQDDVSDPFPTGGPLEKVIRAKRAEEEKAKQTTSEKL